MMQKYDNRMWKRDNLSAYMTWIGLLMRLPRVLMDIFGLLWGMPRRLCLWMLRGGKSSSNYGVIIIGVLLLIGEMMGILSSLEIRICLQGTTSSERTRVKGYRLWDARYMTDSF